MQTVPATVVLGAGNTGLAIGYRVLNLNGTVYSAFTVVNVLETAVLGTYRVTNGVNAPDAGAYIVFGTAVLDLAEQVVSGLPVSILALLVASGALPPGPIDGSSLTITRAATFDVTLTNLVIPANWVTILFTGKANLNAQDSDAVVQVRVSNPASVPNDGLVILRGATAVHAQGNLVPNIGAGTCQVVVTDEATAVLDELDAIAGRWDLKYILATGVSVVSPHGSGSLAVSLTPTRAVV